MTSASQKPVPKRKVIIEKKGIEGALSGATVLVSTTPLAAVYSSSDKVKSLVRKRHPKAAEDMAHPMNMYDFRRYPQIGKLSDMKPNINFSDAGRDFNVDIVVCWASVAFKSNG
mmetsp:Transcript_9839/g.24523  ORF Transcript_9839/g.24523 Transcript_9839/m.24523 type:complete len:114 (-) Transcript_9839:566-907(-)